MAEDVTIDEYKLMIEIVKNIRSGGEVKRFIFTPVEKDALEFVIEFMEKSLDEI